MSETMMISISEVRELVKFLKDTGVNHFEGFGLKLEFRPDNVVNPFAVSDPEERKKAVMDAFKAQKKEDESDLFWST